MSEWPAEDQLAAALSVGKQSDAPSAPCPSASVAWQVAAGDLVPAAVRDYLDHAASCADCTVALRAARSFRRAGNLDAERAGSALARGAARWVAALKGSVLSPLPAAAYLIALSVLLWPMLRTPTPPLPADAAPELSQETPSPRPALSSVHVLTFSGDVQTRGGTEVEIPSLGLGPDDKSVLLQLAVDPVDLRGAVHLRARLSAIAAADRKPDERTIERSAIDEDGLVSLLLDSSTLEPALNYRLDLFAISAGKEPVRIFRQTFRR